MRGLFVGLVIGALQVLALYKLGKMILSRDMAAKLLGVLLMIGKIAVIVVALYLIATVSLTHLIWTAAGMLVGMTAALAAVLHLRRRKEGTANDSHSDGKDISHG